MHSNIRIRKNARAKRFTLRLNHKERCVDLVMPKRASQTQALMFATKYEDWIQEKLSSLPTTILFIDGAILPLFGEDFTLKITHTDTVKTTRIERRENHLCVTTNKDDPAPRIIRHLKSLAKSYIAELATEKAAEIGKDIAAVSVKDTSSRWGSCSSAGKLAFSWRLIFAPLDALDYVVAHEVAHLVHMDHSPAFWSQCKALSHNYKAGKTWIRQHGYTLMRYGG